MWKRNTLKAQARHAYRKNGWAMIAVCFVMAFLTGAYSGSLSTLLQYNSGIATEETVYEQTGEDPFTTLESFINGLKKEAESIRAEEEGFATKGVLSGIVNSVMNSNDLLLRLLRSWNAFQEEHRLFTAIMLLVGSFIHLLYLIFIVNILQVGCKRFFLENRLYRNTRVGRVLFAYHEHRIKHLVTVLFVRDVKLFLWSLTIIGGIIKGYEYRMIPYLLAENPHMSRKQAFALSRQMMHGNKWKTFVLDLSYWYWYLLQFFTLGIVGIFFLNPYTEATMAELYMTLREQVIAAQWAGAEALNDPYLVCKPSGEVPAN